MKKDIPVTRILVRAPNWIGDQILSYPFFYYLRQAYPRAQIGVVCAPWVESLQFLNCVDEVFTLAQPFDSSFRARWDASERTVSRIRETGPWDLGICLPNSFSSAWLFWRAGVRVRRGYRTDSRGFLLNQALDWKKKAAEHRAEAYLGLLTEPSSIERVSKKFWGVPSANDLDPGEPPVQKHFSPGQAWPEAEIIEPPKGPYWILAPGSKAESRRWPVERYVELARRVQTDTGWKGLVIGGAEEVALAAELVKDRSLNLADWTARGSVAGYWKIFENAAFSVCNDSGLAHVAAFCGSPVQIVWGAGQPLRTEPLGPGRVRIIFQPVDCWPCEKNVCLQSAGNYLACLRGIQVDQVWEEIQGGIRKKAH